MTALYNPYLPPWGDRRSILSILSGSEHWRSGMSNDLGGDEVSGVQSTTTYNNLQGLEREKKNVIR